MAKQQLTSNTVACQLLFGHNTSRGISNTPKSLLPGQMWKALRRGSYGNAELPNLSLHSYILRSAVKQGPALQCSSTHRGLRLVVPIHSNLVPHVAFQCLADLLQFLAFLSFFPCGFQKRAWPAPVSTLMAKEKKTICLFAIRLDSNNNDLQVDIYVRVSECRKNIPHVH